MTAPLGIDPGLAARDATIEAQRAEIERLHRTMSNRSGGQDQNAVFAVQAATIERLSTRLADVYAFHIRDVGLLQAEVTKREQALSSMKHTISWRVTAPIRWVRRLVASLIRGPRATMRAALSRALQWFRGHPKVSAGALRVLRAMPPIERRVLAFARARNNPQSRHGKSPSNRWALDVDSAVLAEWRRLLETRRQA